MQLFVILAIALVAFGVWLVFHNKRSKNLLIARLRECGFNFEDGSRLIMPEAILLNDPAGERILLARGTNYLKETRPESAIAELPYAGIKSFVLTADHEPVDLSTLAQSLRAPRIVEMRLVDERNNTHDFLFNPDDLAKKNVKPLIAWWAALLHELATANSKN